MMNNIDERAESDDGDNDEMGDDESCRCEDVCEMDDADDDAGRGAEDGSIDGNNEDDDEDDDNDDASTDGNVYVPTDDGNVEDIARIDSRTEEGKAATHAHIIVDTRRVNTAVATKYELVYTT